LLASKIFLNRSILSRPSSSNIGWQSKVENYKI
jgi:hypothetical protein